MLNEDSRRTYLPRDPARVAALYEATNQPLVQPSGRPSQPARGAVVALERNGLYEAVVAITLADSGDNVIYAGEKVAEHELSQALEDALDFAESMGFILDASGWANLDEDHRLELIDRIPAFHPPQEKKAAQVVERPRSSDPLAAVARLFAAFCVLLLVSCSGLSADQRVKGAEVHQQLGDNLLRQGDPRQALKEYLDSLTYEELPEAHLGAGLIYAWSLGRPEEGEKEFKRALEMRPDYAEALTNLGALYISRGRFKEAVEPLSVASHDALYKARVLAQSNLGWALYKSGQGDRGISEIRGALAVAPKYCLGWRQLGTIYSELGRVDDATAAFGKYAETCPEAGDAHLNLGKALARQSKATEARAEFERCAVAKDDKDAAVASECQRFLKQMGTP
ncbi:MAG TPA: tetratricopeptide repeat protein [Myxococcales bacterium]|nr:tetratricopeptide repeat protein [Myxococcales bacterium]